MLNIDLPHEQEIPFLHKYIKEMKTYVHTEPCTWMLITKSKTNTKPHKTNVEEKKWIQKIPPHWAIRLGSFFPGTVVLESTIYEAGILSHNKNLLCFHTHFWLCEGWVLPGLFPLAGLVNSVLSASGLYLLRAFNDCLVPSCTTSVMIQIWNVSQNSNVFGRWLDHWGSVLANGFLHWWVQ